LAHEQLFDGTVLENIAMGRPEATFEHVQWAVKNLRLETFISNLPLGFDTQLDPLGRKLNKSVIQKLLLARAIVHKPKLLLLEDALEHLDSAERAAIVDFLVDEKYDWSIVAVSGDAYFQSKVNRVGTMNNGELSF